MLFDLSTLNIVFGVVYYLELFVVYLVLYCQQRLNWLFGHYKTLISLLGKNYINSKKI